MKLTAIFLLAIATAVTAAPEHHTCRKHGERCNPSIAPQYHEYCCPGLFCDTRGGPPGSSGKVNPKFANPCTQSWPSANSNISVWEDRWGQNRVSKRAGERSWIFSRGLKMGFFFSKARQEGFAWFFPHLLTQMWSQDHSLQAVVVSVVHFCDYPISWIAVAENYLHCLASSSQCSVPYYYMNSRFSP